MFFHQTDFYFALFILTEIENLNLSKLLPIISEIHLSLAINACFVTCYMSICNPRYWQSKTKFTENAFRLDVSVELRTYP